MSKDTGTSNPDLCFFLIFIWHILWLKRGSRVAMYDCRVDMYDCILLGVLLQACEEQVQVCAQLRADIVSGDVETPVYASEYNYFLFEANFFFF